MQAKKVLASIGVTDDVPATMLVGSAQDTTESRAFAKGLATGMANGPASNGLPPASTNRNFSCNGNDKCACCCVWDAVEPPSPGGPSTNVGCACVCN